MAAWRPPRGSDQRLYLVLPAERVVALLGAEACPLGPLAEPEPPALPAPAPEPAPAGPPAYGPRPRPAQDNAATRGFFLDRYVY